MTKQLNGVFRSWVRQIPSRGTDLPIIWGDCIAHFSNPEFSGQVLHTSGILEITEHKSLKLAETRNNFYLLLGPELPWPEDMSASPHGLIMSRRESTRSTDVFVSAALNANSSCRKCLGSGVFREDEGFMVVCDACCGHRQGWWMLEGLYGTDNGRWACKAGCGVIVDHPPDAIKFLPRTLHEGYSRQPSPSLPVLYDAEKEMAHSPLPETDVKDELSELTSWRPGAFRGDGLLRHLHQEKELRA